MPKERGGKTHARVPERWRKYLVRGIPIPAWVFVRKSLRSGSHFNEDQVICGPAQDSELSNALIWFERRAQVVFRQQDDSIKTVELVRMLRFPKRMRQGNNQTLDIRKSVKAFVGWWKFAEIKLES